MKSRVRHAVIIGSTLAFAALSRCSAARSSDSVRRAPLGVGESAPRFAVKSLGGDSLVVGDTTPAITLLNVWATWCTSCREEFAELERLRGAFTSKGLRVMAISVDQGSDVKVRRFVAAQGSTFPVAHDADSRITSLYGVSGLPTSYLLSGNGTVLWRAIGDFRLDSAGLAAAIDRALTR